jgi:hypothetical protein
MATRRYEVIVSRINEPEHAEPYETVLADQIEITPEGSLRLSWEDGGRFFSGTLWSGITVKVLPHA